MGALKIEEDGIRVLGRAHFDKPVHFSQLSTARVSSVCCPFIRRI